MRRYGPFLTATLGVAVALALLAPDAAAQEKERHGHGAKEKGRHGRMTAGPHHGRMDGMAMLGHVPTAILHQEELLGLSRQQVSRLQALRDSVEAARKSGMSAMKDAHGRLEKALGADGLDLAAYREAVRSAADRMVKTHVRVATLARDALRVLDEAQREKFLYGMRLMQEMRKMHGHGEDGHGDARHGAGDRERGHGPERHRDADHGRE